MKREIKFRGKDCETGGWLYGNLIQRIGRYPGIMFNYEHGGKIHYAEHSVKQETVGQFTGLLDYNGKEIYEGDIFTVNGKYPKVVKFISEQAAFCIANIDELNKDYIYPWQQPSSDWWDKSKREIIIIGNIHDNPELLKGE